MIEWIHGLGCRSACGRFTLHRHGGAGVYGLWSLYDYSDQWPEQATLPDGRKTPSVSTFRSMKDAKHEAERRVQK